MSKTLLSAVRGRNNPSGTTAGSTQYWNLANSSLFPSTTAAQREVTWHTPGTLSKLYVRVITNSASATCTVAVRKTGIDSAMAITIPAGFVGVVENSSDELSVADGDKLVYKTVSGGTGAVTFAVMSVLFETTTPVSRHTMEGYAVTAASVNHFVPICGDRSGTTGTESSTEATIKKACTLKNAFVFIQSNARTTTTTFTLRKNRVDTAIILTAAGGVTGIVEDITNPVSFAVDDEISWKITTLTGTESLSFHSLSVDIENTGNFASIFAGSVGASSDSLVNAATTTYAAIGGSHFFDTTEDNQKQKARAAFTLSNLVIRAGANTITAESTFTLRKNGLDTSLVARLTSSTAGFFSDTTHTESVGPDDELSLKLTTGVTGTTITITNFSLSTEFQEVIQAIGSGGGSQGRSPLYRTRRREPDIAIAIVRVRIALQYEVEKLSVQVKLPLLVPQKRLIKYASAILTPIARILSLPIKPTPPPPVQRIVSVSIPLTYEVTNLQLKAACSYQVDRLFTQEQQHKIVATSINFLLGDLI